jgi:hypothetical protein
LNETESVKFRIDDEEELISTGSKPEDRMPAEKRSPRYAEIVRPKSMAVRFWDLTMITLREKAPSNWSKFVNFLSMIKDIAIGGEPQIEIVMARDGLMDFVDFMLGQNSPNAKPGERRPKMGSVYGSPNFGPLLEVVSHLIVRCYTSKFTKDSTEIPTTAAKNVPRYYEISDENIEKFFLHEDFLKIAIINSSDILGEAFAHLSYKNLEVSKAIGKVILKTINTSDYEKIKQCMTVCKPYLYIADEFQRNRVEWILGFSSLSTTNAVRGSLHKFGTTILTQICDEAYSYISPIDLNKNSDALLALLWRYRGRMDFYVINCLNILLEIIVENQFLSEYMFNLDPPTYEYARFTDWFRPYLEKELDKARKNMTYRHSTKKEEQIVKCFCFLEIYEAKLKKYENKLRGLPEEDTKQSTNAAEQSIEEEKKNEKKVGFEDTAYEPSDNPAGPVDRQDDSEGHYREGPVIDHYPQNYILGCTTNIADINREEREGIIVTTQKVFIEYAESQPTLTGNKTLPSYAFYNSRAEAEDYDRKYAIAQMNEFDKEQEQMKKDLLDDETTEETIYDTLAKDDLEEGDNQNRKDTPNITVSRVGEESSAVSQVKVSTKSADPETTGDADSQDPEEPNEPKSDWNLPKKIGDIVITIIVENTTTKGHNFSLRLICDDDLARENIKVSVNEISSYIKPHFYDMWMCIQKVNPDKDWGQFHLEWDAQVTNLEAKQTRMMQGYGNSRDENDDYDAYVNHMYGPAIFHTNFYSIT